MSNDEKINDISRKVFDLYRKKGSGDYVGEKVSQLEHATQCAMLAEKEGYNREVILGAFLHDIGHLLGESGSDHMFTDGTKLGVSRHERVGQKFLEELGVPHEVTAIVCGHVDAKRYLCYKHPIYLKNLSPASTMTLQHQGGPMSAKEAQEFEASPFFDIIIKARKWDEAGKVEGMVIDPMEKYEDLFQAMMQNVLLFE